MSAEIAADIDRNLAQAAIRNVSRQRISRLIVHPIERAAVTLAQDPDGRLVIHGRAHIQRESFATAVFIHELRGRAGGARQQPPSQERIAVLPEGRHGEGAIQTLREPFDERTLALGGHLHRVLRIGGVDRIGEARLLCERGLRLPQPKIRRKQAGKPHECNARRERADRQRGLAPPWRTDTQHDTRAVRLRDGIREQRTQGRALRTIVRHEACRLRIGGEPLCNGSPLRFRQLPIDERRKRVELGLAVVPRWCMVAIVTHHVFLTAFNEAA